MVCPQQHHTHNFSVTRASQVHWKQYISAAPPNTSVLPNHPVPFEIALWDSPKPHTSGLFQNRHAEQENHRPYCAAPTSEASNHHSSTTHSKDPDNLHSALSTHACILAQSHASSIPDIHRIFHGVVLHILCVLFLYNAASGTETQERKVTYCNCPSSWIAHS